MTFTDALCTPTYSVSVPAGNLGRISMSKQEMVWLLHSEHSHTAGQEDAGASDTVLLMGRVTSVNSAHVITCILESILTLCLLLDVHSLHLSN